MKAAAEDADSTSRDRQTPKKKGPGQKKKGAAGDPDQARVLAERRDKITARIEQAESRLEAIDATFADPGFYDGTALDEVRALESERNDLLTEVEKLVSEWERIESEMEQLR